MPRIHAPSNPGTSILAGGTTLDRLPRPLTSFIGRSDEVSAVGAMVADDAIQLVTITGPGGIGKTRLAIEVARQAVPEYRDGVAFLSLVKIRDARLLPMVVAGALGVSDVTETSIVDRLRESCYDLRTLLVLDNLEHLLEATSILGVFAGQCPGISMLCTSRARLGLSGEHVFQLPPLTGSQSITLFEERARALVPDYVLTVDSRLEIAEVCEHLDGLPLAIELAAARVPVLTPAAMRKRLDDRMTLLSHGRRDAHDRHQGMRQAIAWSHDLLTPVDQVLFRRLAVFDGGFTLDAAADATGMTSDILDGIASLESSSLVRSYIDSNGQPRFRMLETIREFAAERLHESGEQATMRQAHASYFVRLADGTERIWWVPEGQAKVDQVEVEFANIRAALAWLKEENDVDAVLSLAGSLAPLWASRGYSREGQAWLEWGLPRASDYATPAVILATRALSWILNQHGELYRSLLLAQQVLALSREVPDTLNTVNSLILSGIAAQRLGLAELAFSFQTTALEVLDASTGEPWARTSRCIAMNQLGQTALDQGELDVAERWFTNSLDFQQTYGLRFAHGGHSVRFLGEVARARGIPDHAMHLFQSALELSIEMRDVRTIAILQACIAGALAATSHHELAARLFGASEAQHERIAMPFVEGMFERQRALGLPEPWASAGTSHGVSQPLYEALETHTAAIRSVQLDPDLAREWWDQGRRLSVDDAIALALAPVPDMGATGQRSDDELSPRELEVLRLLAAGLKNQEIGESLSISTRTVENHVRNILTKLELPSRTAAVAHAYRHDLI